MNIFLNATKTTVRLSAKPMSLDKLYWQIVDLDGNNSEPLSFRTWGAFTCTGLPLVEKAIADEGASADALASEVVQWADTQLEAAMPKLDAGTFSIALAEHPNQIERGAYAISYVTSLIDEGNLDVARQAATAYLDGSVQSVSRHTHGGRDFHEIAVEWIDSSESSV